MALPNVSPSRLAPNFYMIHATDLEQQYADADAIAATVGQPVNNNNAHQNQGNEFILVAISSTINLPGIWLDKPRTWFNMSESAFAVRQISPLSPSTTTSWENSPWRRWLWLRMW